MKKISRVVGYEKMEEREGKNCESTIGAKR